MTTPVAVVTGASSGIGRALAKQLDAEGYSLVLCDVNEPGLRETQALLKRGSQRVTLDVSKRNEVDAMAAEVIARHGRIDLVINNAGVTIDASLAEVSIEDFEWLFGINFWGVVYGTKAFLPLMLAQRDGHIVNMSSVFGLIGGRAQGPYNITKFGVRGLTECLWRELEGTGVKATNVHPGGIKTSIGAKARWGVNAGTKTREMHALLDKILVTPPEDCARDILRGVARGKRRILTGNGARAIAFFSRLLPVRHVPILKALMGA